MTADKAGILAFAESQYKVGADDKANWNGRQIRNAFQTAAAIAEYEARKAEEGQVGPGPKIAVQARLHSGHFHVVADASLQFDLYLNDIDDNTEMDRNDSFDQFAPIYGEKPSDGVYKPSVSFEAQGSRNYSSNARTYDGQGIRRRTYSPNPVAYPNREAHHLQASFNPHRRPKHSESDSGQPTAASSSKQTHTPKASTSSSKHLKKPEPSANTAARKEAYVESKRRQLAPPNLGGNTIAAVKDETDSDDDSENNYVESDEELEEND